MSAPEVSVVIPSHDRHLRLRWLLNALEDQTLDRERFEVIVVHDYEGGDAQEIIGRHPLAEAGVLTEISIPAGQGSPSKQRNLGWRAARGSLIAFTDDDCRPEPSWLSSLLDAATENPGAILQGRTRPDPLELDVFVAPHHRSMHIDPPGQFAQTCNIAYPREVLERLGGFDEELTVGEDVDLSVRAREAGAPLVGVADAVVFHAVEAYSLLGMIRLNRKWEHIPYVLKKHPALRSRLYQGVFWKTAHRDVCLALAGLALARSHRLGIVLTAPYVIEALNARGKGRRRRLVAAAELPGRTLVDAAEVATLVRGSVRYRCPVL